MTTPVTIDKYRDILKKVSVVVKRRFPNMTTEDNLDFTMEMVGIVIKELMDNET